MSSPAPLTRVEAALREAGSQHSSGQDWTCPAHDDQRASLGVAVGRTGKVVLKCQAGCSTSKVLRALGLSMRDLAPSERRRVVDRYVYTDEAGAPLFRVLRYDTGTRFTQESWTGSRWRPGGIKDVPSVLFGLPKVRKAVQAGRRVLLCEGEKDVQAAEAAGEAATCNPGGAGKWLDEYTEQLRGARVVIVADRDAAGYKHAAAVYRNLRAAGVKTYLRLPVPEHKGADLADHLAAGYSMRQLVKVKLADLKESEGDGDVSKLGHILSRAELSNLPAPAPLIEGVVSARSAVLMVGASGTNKTFTALAFACCCATDTAWLGHEVVRPGAVVYVVGEGAYGLHTRIAAWEQDAGRRVPSDRLTVLMKPESILEEEFWDQLRSLVRQVRAVLVVFDTFSSLAPAADETKDAATTIRRLSDLAADTSSTSMLLHHTGWGPQDRARGGSQLEANADEVLVLERTEEDPRVVSLRMKKVKDGPSGATTWLRRVEMGDSCVLEKVPTELAPVDKRPSAREELEQAILRTLRDHDPYSFTETGVLEKVGGNAKASRSAFARLRESGRILVDLRTRTEGKRAVERELVALNPVYAADGVERLRIKSVRGDRTGLDGVEGEGA